MTLGGHDDIGIQTDDIFKPMTLDRPDLGIQTDFIHRLKNIGTQTLEDIIHSCRRTVDDAFGSSTLKGERLLQRRKFKGNLFQFKKKYLFFILFFFQMIQQN